MHPLRIWAVAANSFREALRDRLLYFIGVFVLGIAIAARLLPEIAALTEDKIFLDVGIGAIGLLGVLLAIFAGTSTIAREIDQRTVLVTLTKPLSPGEFVVGKYLGLWGAIALAVLGMGAIYLGFVSWQGIPADFGPLAIAAIFLLLELGVLIAIAIVFSVFTGSILAGVLCLGIYGIGHLSRDWVELGKLSENATIERVTQVLYLVLPNLARLNFRNEVVYGILPPSSELWADAAYGLAYTALLLALATLVFSRRQF